MAQSGSVILRDWAQTAGSKCNAVEKVIPKVQQKWSECQVKNQQAIHHAMDPVSLGKRNKRKEHLILVSYVSESYLL